MKKLITMLLAVIFAGAFATDWVPVAGDIINNPAQPSLDSKTYTWHTYGGTAYTNYRGVTERAMLVNAEDFGFDYPVNFNGVQAYLNDVGITFSYRIYARDGVTVLWDQEYTTTKLGYEIVQPAAPIVLNDDFYLVLVPYLPGDGKGYPSLIVSYDGVPGHCFYGAPGSWTTRDPYQYMMYAALEQYTGTDVNGPSARTIYGGDAFMDYDADIVLAVTDESSISTLTGAYSVDGGTTWLNVEMAPSKANYFEYVGTIPAQPDSTVGEVVFFISDNLGNPETVSVPFPLSWSKDNPIYSQGFEGNFPPAAWSTNYVGAGFIKVPDDPIFDQVYSGNYAAAHMDDSGAQDDWLITPLITVPADNSTTLTFWQNSIYVSYHTLHEVCVSTDMTTWTTIYDIAPTVDNVWEKIYLSLKDYVGQDIYIGFHYAGDYSDQWFIDEVDVLYDYEGPTVVDLTGNEALLPIVGAFLNNDMELSVTVNDLSGAQSVLGHYSFDEGTTIVDLPFTKAKGGDEVWTAVIPQQAAVDSGYINFDITDIGGIAAPVSDDFRIDFVFDGIAPVFNYVKGTLAFVNDPMNLEVSFSDESAISSCTGFYSKDGGTSWTPFAMDPAKIHTYIYTGSIPAETAEVLDGQVFFRMKDVEGNVLDSDIITVKWMDGQNSIIEDFESGAGNWTFAGFTGAWAIVEDGEYTSPTHALTDSPIGNYADKDTTSAQWAVPFDLSTNPSAVVSFWTKFEIEDGWDYVYFEGSNDNGVSWVRSAEFTGTAGWHEETVSMDAFAGQSNIIFRFLFVSDDVSNEDGIYIDDLKLITYNIDHAPPSIISDPYAPFLYEGTLGDYTDKIEVIDFSGLANVTVYYTVDGGAEESVTAINTSENWYEFTIPAQAPGSLVQYRIYAVDGSAQSNEDYSEYYSYLAGDQMIYDSGVVTSYHTAEDNLAWAVRITVPGSDESKTIMTGKLESLLLRSYWSTTTVSENMVVHVWDDAAGLPGIELITPFDVASEANAADTYGMTKVDLRSYDLNVSGDFWIGISAPYGPVYMPMESADEVGTTEYRRSYTGTWNAGLSAWTWAEALHDNWHFRAVLDGVYTGIEDETVPMVTELQQNYPNPFNPATTINFSLANDSKVSLVVYDVMGREVANLVNGEMVKGSHKVSFDASRLVSGVYYYNLKAGNVNQTKKMMLIK
jgi:hypothetical protein